MDFVLIPVFRTYPLRMAYLKDCFFFFFNLYGAQPAAIPGPVQDISWHLTSLFWQPKRWNFREFCSGLSDFSSSQPFQDPKWCGSPCHESHGSCRATLGLPRPRAVDQTGSCQVQSDEMNQKTIAAHSFSEIVVQKHSAYFKYLNKKTKQCFWLYAIPLKPPFLYRPRNLVDSSWNVTLSRARGNCSFAWQRLADRVIISLSGEQVWRYTGSHLLLPPGPPALGFWCFWRPFFVWKGRRNHFGGGKIGPKIPAMAIFPWVSSPSQRIQDHPMSRAVNTYITKGHELVLGC